MSTFESASSHGHDGETDVEIDTLSLLSGRIVYALGEQLELHVELAKAELARDVRKVGRPALGLVLGGAALAMGYTFLAAGVALAVALWLGSATGFGIVGFVHALIGGWLVRRHLNLLAVQAQHPETGTTLGGELARSLRALLGPDTAAPGTNQGLNPASPR